MRYSDDFRKEIFDKYVELEFKILHLRSIVQNPMEIKGSDLSEQKSLGINIIREIEYIQERLQKGI